jgi:hypothetical protein
MKRCALSMVKLNQKGQSMVEYLVVTSAILFALGLGVVDNNSVLRMMWNALRLAYQKFSFSLSLPM